MAILFVNVQSYRLFGYTGNPNTRYTIYVQGTIKNTVKKAGLNISFLKPGLQPIANTRSILADGTVLINAQMMDTEYLKWVDLVRNEKPLEMKIEDNNLVDLYTLFEDAGAHEIGA